MSGLFTTLNSVAQALNSDSYALSITANNIANVDNTSYAREQVAFSDGQDVQTAQGLESLGVQATLVSTANSVLDQQVMNEAGSTSTYQTQQDLLQQAQAGLGETISNSSATSSSTSASDSGISSALDTFMNSLSALAAEPNDSGTQEAVLEDASALTDIFNSASSNLAQVQAGAQAGIASNVSTANGLLKNIAELNSQIASAASAGPGAAASLVDDRESALEQLAAIIPVTVTQQASGEDLVTTTGANGTPVTLIQNAVVQGPLAYANGTLTGGSGASALAPATGSIQGAIAATTGPIQDLGNSLDALAGQLVTSVNGIYNPGGAPSADFFVAGGTTAGTIAVNPALTQSTLVAGTGAAGDNSIAVSLANLANTTFSTASGDLIDGTFSSSYASTVAALGTAVDTASTNLTDQTQVQTMVQTQRSSVSGVNMDQEMSNLVQFQQAYQASSQVFGIVQQMLGSLIQSLGSG